MFFDGITRFGSIHALTLGLLVWAGQSLASAQLSLNIHVLDQPVTKPASVRSSSPGARQLAIKLGEPVSIRIELTNSGGAPVEVFPNLESSAGFVSFFCSGVDESFKKFTTLRWEIKDVLVKPAMLPPGGKLVHETYLFGKLRPDLQLEYLFAKPGVYRIQAELMLPAGAQPVRSNEVSVSVDASVPLWAQLQAAGIVNVVEGRSRSNPEHQQRVRDLREILKQSPGHSTGMWVK